MGVAYIQKGGFVKITITVLYKTKLYIILHVKYRFRILVMSFKKRITSPTSKLSLPPYHFYFFLTPSFSGTM